MTILGKLAYDAKQALSRLVTGDYSALGELAIFGVVSIFVIAKENLK